MFALNGALFGIWASRIPAIAEIHHLSHGTLGALLLLMASGAILSFPIAGRLSDRLGAYQITIWSAVAYTLCLFLISVAPNLAALAAALFLFGATHGAMDVAMNSWASEVERQSGKPIMSSFHAMFSLGAGLGAGSGFLAVQSGLSPGPHFLAAGLIIFCATIILGRIGWQSDIASRPSKAAMFAVPKGPLLLVGFVAFCSSLGEGAMADWSAIFLINSTGTSEAVAALGYAVFSIAMVAMRLIGDRIVHRFGALQTARFAGMSALIGSLCAVTFATLPMVLIGFALMGVGYAVVIPLAFSRAANDPNMAPGAAIASVSTLGYGGILLGPPIIGFLAEATSIRMAFLLLSALAIMIILLAKILQR